MRSERAHVTTIADQSWIDSEVSESQLKGGGGNGFTVATAAAQDESE